MNEQRPLDDDPAIVANEAVVEGWSRDDRGDEPGR